MQAELERLDALLRAQAADLRMDDDERHELRDVGARVDADLLRYMRGRAFDIARDALEQGSARPADVLRWLEAVVRTLEINAVAAAAPTTAFFSPGDAAVRKLREMCATSRDAIDACVFTIADDRLTDALLDAHRRGVRVRVITDDDKRFDTGSDVARLIEAGIEVRMDASSFHMHHKFALFDGKRLANGSFNWTRSASTSNNENLVVSADAYLVRCFAGEFDSLWKKFAA